MKKAALMPSETNSGSYKKALRFVCSFGNSCTVLLFCFLLLSAVRPSAVSSQTQKNVDPVVKAESDLFFTYAGLFGTAGSSKVDYKGWDSETNKEISSSSTGTFYGGGVMLDVFVRNVIGDFRIGYMMNNTSDKNTKLNHLTFSASGKYLFSINPVFGLTAGAGLYFECAPSDRSYNGAGGELSVGTIIDLADWDLKIQCDGFGRYGFFGQDAKSKKMNAGGSLGVTKKVGRS